MYTYNVLGPIQSDIHIFSFIKSSQQPYQMG